MFKPRFFIVILAVLWLTLVSCGSRSATLSTTSQASPQEATQYGYEVIATYPHDISAFTQGLVYISGSFYEGTGLIGQSTIRKVDLDSGKVRELRELPAPYFGEGITIFHNRLYQLTWKSNTGFIYDPETFDLLQEFHYDTEGWGLTHDGRNLIMSNGTGTLLFLDPGTLEVVSRLEVKDIPPHLGNIRLNELEYIKGSIYANLWPTSYIIIVDSDTGYVTGWVDLSDVLTERPANADAVLNGIAYDEESDRLFITGKLWPSLFEIKLTAAAQ